jgi:beta-1,4-N-acetylglucosaminyltransferase
MRERPSLVLCNGPGTCIPIVMASWALRLSGLQHAEICFVESFCRVNSLSLSGKLLIKAASVGLCEHFLVQWPQLVGKYPRATCIGRLC